MLQERFQRLFWWGEASEPAPERVAAQVMVLGDLRDVHEVRERFGVDIFAKVLASPPPGLFDAKSWVYWHKKLGRVPVPPLPVQPAPWPAR